MDGSGRKNALRARGRGGKKGPSREGRAYALYNMRPRERKRLRPARGEAREKK